MATDKAAEKTDGKVPNKKRSAAMKKAWRRRRAMRRSRQRGEVPERGSLADLKAAQKSGKRLSFGEEVGAYETIKDILDALPPGSRRVVVAYLNSRY